MSDAMPMPKRGKIWDPARDSKLSIPTEAEMTRQHRREIGVLAREMGTKTIAEIEAERLRSSLRRIRAPELDEPIALDDLPKHSPIAKAKRAAKTPKPEKPKRAVKPDGYITIGELCEKWKIKPLHARTALRASDLVKPEFGWAFAPKDVPKIAKLCGVK